MLDRSRLSARSRTEPELDILSRELNEEQWGVIEDLFPTPPPGPEGGRPRIDSRACFEGVLWVLRTGARWKDLPRSFPSYPTCWRRFVEWTTSGLVDRALERLAAKLDESGRLNWEEGFADGTFASAKKGAIALAPLAAARERRSCFSPMVRACRWRSKLTRPITPKST